MKVIDLIKLIQDAHSDYDVVIEVNRLHSELKAELREHGQLEDQSFLIKINHERRQFVIATTYS